MRVRGLRLLECRVRGGRIAHFRVRLRQKREEAQEVAHIQALLDEADASGVDPRPGERIIAEVRAKYFGADA